MSFWSELKRRNVFKVAVAYLIVAWLIVQVVSIAFPAFHMPTWTVTFVMSLLIVGFPVVLIFAWAFEITPEGLKLTKDVPHHESITHLTGKKLNYILIGVIVLAVAYILFDNFYLDKLAIQTEVESRVAALAPPAVEEEESLKSIVVLPFDDLSPEKDQEYFVDGLWEELSNCLAKIPDISVTSKVSAFSFKDRDKTAQEISSILGVAHILEGSVRKAGDELRITVQLIRAADDRHLWSNTYDGELKDIFDIQENIAKAVADELKVALGIDQSFRQLGGTDNAEAYEYYLVALGSQLQGGNLERAQQYLDAALDLDPKFARAWSQKATFHNINSGFMPSNLVDSELDKALSAALKAIELEPTLPEAYSSLGGTKMERSEWIEAELAFGKARELTTEIILGDAYHNLLLRVGNFEKAFKNIEDQKRINSFNPTIRGFYITCLCFLGDINRAEEEYKNSIALFGDTVFDWQLMEIEFCIVDSIPLYEILPYLPINDEARKTINEPEDALAEFHRLYNNSDNLSPWQLKDIALWSAYFGDPELAMDALKKLAMFDHMIWFPVMHEVRQLPRFKEFVREIGLVNYWEQFEWPDLCHPTDDGDFVCD